MMGDGGRRRRWEAETGKCAGNGGSEGDGEIRRNERDKEEDYQAGVCAG